jgi:hypothetical protein
MGAQRTVLSTDLDLAFADNLVSPYGDATVGALRLMCETLRTLIAHPEVTAPKAGAFWSTASHPSARRPRLARGARRRCAP